MNNNQQANESLPLIIAHRGASNEAPENTRAAFKLAFEQQADGIEGDFRVTADNRIVCIHDDSTHRTGTENYKIAETSLETLQKVDVGSRKNKKWRGETILTLEDVLELIPPRRYFFFEIKDRNMPSMLQETLTRIPFNPEYLRIISFYPDIIQHVKTQLPHIRADLLVQFQWRGNEWFPSRSLLEEGLRRINADGVGCENKPKIVNQDFVDFFSSRGFRVGVWTVDLPKQAESYKKLGVASITTNRPKLIKSIL